MTYIGIKRMMQMRKENNTRPPENIILFRKLMKVICECLHVRVLGKVTLVDEKGNRW